MMRLSLIGNIGNDPDMRYSASGSPLLRFNVASNYRTRTPEGEWQERTEWVRVTVTGNRAESLSQYLKKGSRIFVDGKLEARPWTDNQGQVRAGLEMFADTIEFFSPRNEDGQQPTRPSVTDERRDRPQQGAGDDDDLDSLPF
jgi:single-strand DNA-binding protein